MLAYLLTYLLTYLEFSKYDTISLSTTAQLQVKHESELFADIH